MSLTNRSLIGIGLYSIPEAARLTQVPPASIRRWFFGYRYHDRTGRQRNVPPLWEGDAPAADDFVGLSFLDLMEVRMVYAFRRHRVSWKAIREAAARACSMYNSGHPFTFRKFRTDGNRVFTEIEEQGEIRLFDLNRQHYVLGRIVEPTLYEGIEFHGDQAVRWFPKAGGRRVVLDPDRSFGQPIVAEEGVPTAILAKALEVEESATFVAKWYDVSVFSVRAAARFEARLAA